MRTAVADWLAHGEWCERGGGWPSNPPSARVGCADRVARPGLTPCRVLSGEEGRHFLPQPEQPFDRSRGREHGVDEGLVASLELSDTACRPQQRADLGDFARVGGAQTIALAKPLQAQVTT